MRHGTIKTAVVFVAGLLVVCGASPAIMAQQSSSNTTNTPQQQAPPPDDNSFPSDVSHKAADDKKKAEQPTGSDTSGDSTQKPSDADQNKTPPAAGDDSNAFPEDTSRKAADAAKADAAKDTGDTEGSSNSGVSSSSDYDRRSSGRNSVPTNVPMPHANGKDPIKEDLNVGSYYLDAGNFAGAYLRYKDAISLAPENMDAIFGLAEAARHLKRRDEALANYQLFLQVVSSGSKAKDARKAVASLEKTK